MAVGLFEQVLEDDMISISLSAKGIGDTGMLGFGFGGLTMSDAQVWMSVLIVSARRIASQHQNRGLGSCVDGKHVNSQKRPLKLTAVVTCMRASWRMCQHSCRII